MHSHAARAEPIHPMHAPEIIRLRDQIDTLREENRQLRREIGAADDATFVRHCCQVFGVTKSRAHLLSVLMAAKVNSKQGLLLAYSDPARETPDIKIITTLVSDLRAALKPHGITIDTAWGQGYSVPAESKAKIRALVADWAAQQ